MNHLINRVTIRAATTADLPQLEVFEQGVVEAERPYNELLKAGPVHYYDIAALIASDRSLLLVAEYSGRLIGSGYVALTQSLAYLQHETHAYLGFMYVDPQYRGQGIVRQVLEGLMQWSRQQGVSDFYLDVYADNRFAIKAYEKFGFRSNLIEMKLTDRR